MNLEGIYKELKFKTSRSGGAGGQHVNKVSTRVELCFDVEHSGVLSEKQKAIISYKLRNRMDSRGVLHIHCDESRSQLKNKAIAYERFTQLLEQALKPVKKRKATKPGKAAIKKRLDAKKKRSEKKESRRFDPDKA
ncbi:MAG: aminoacyl-tRNA hydrolase [Flavobacteriales bacterium]|nr:aminoacyl-tRNA hydrolase [Flavobacteriales bacterium]